MKMHTQFGLGVVLLGVCLTASTLRAANGIWNSDANGTWSTSVATNPPWTGGVVASGSGFTADFNTINITADRTISLGEAITIGNLIFGDTTVSSAGSWILNNGGNAANTLTLDGTTPTITVNTLGTSKNVTISAVIAGSAGLTKAGAGTLVLSGANTFTGGISVTGGTLSISGNTDANLGAAGGSVTLSNNAILQTTTDSGTTGSGRSLIIGTGGGRLNVGGFSPRTMSFNIQGSETLTLSAGSSGIRFNGNNTGFTGTYVINSGGASFETANASPTLANSLLIGSGGGLVAVNLGTYTSAQSWLSSGVIQTSSTGGLWLTGVNNSENVDFTGYGSLFLGASNFVNLGSPNTVNYTGTITTADGTYRLGSNVSSNHVLNMNATNQLTGARNVIIGNGTQTGTVMISQSNDYTGGTTVNSNGNLIVAHSNALGGGSVTVNAPLTGVNSGLRLQGGVNVSNTLNLAGFPNDSNLGTLRSVSGANVWSGNVNLTAGARISADNASGNSLTISGDVSLGANSLSIMTGNTSANVGGDILISGDISGSGATAISKNNSTGTLTLSGDNTFTGAVNLSGGMIALGSNSALGTGAGTFTINAGNGATAGVRSTDATARDISNAFAISSGNATNTYVFGAASGGTGNLTFTNAGTTSLGTVVRTFQVNNRSQFNGIFSGSGAGINKTGNGILVLNGVNTYTGATTVSAGTLLVNGALATTSAVSVSSGATLGGSGRVGAISGAGMVGPGNSPGILRATSIDPSGGMDYSFQLAVATPTWSDTVNSGNDVLRLDGATPITTAMTSANEFNLYFTAGGIFVGGLYTDENADFTALISSATFNYYLLDGAGAVNYDGQTYSVLDPGDVTWDVIQIASADFASGTINNGWAMEFNVNAIPEPSTYALMAFGLGALALLRMKKK